MTTHADVAAISNHIERNIGPIAMVFHEILSDDLHIDIHHVKSSFFRRREILVTSGMSALPMAAPADSRVPRFAEIVAVLPKGWPLTSEAFEDEDNYWPVRLMKTLARFPHASGSWLGVGHTLANGVSDAEIEPYAPGTSLCAVALLPSTTLRKKAWVMKRSDGEEVHFLAAVPLHRAELQLKLDKGIDPLLALFDQHGVTDEIDARRASVV